MVIIKKLILKCRDLVTVIIKKFITKLFSNYSYIITFTESIYLVTVVI
jgi:hypothetical protein